MARISGVGTLSASADTTVDSTAQDRSIRIRVYNEDTVNHDFTFKIGSTAQKKVTLAAGEDAVFGPENVANGTNVVVNNAQATTTTAPKYGKTGEYDG